MRPTDGVPFPLHSVTAGSYVYAFTQPIFKHVHSPGRVPGAAFLVDSNRSSGPDPLDPRLETTRRLGWGWAAAWVVVNH